MELITILFGPAGESIFNGDEFPFGELAMAMFLLFFFTLWNFSIAPLVVVPLVKLIRCKPGGGISPICICPHWIVGIIIPYSFFGFFGLLLYVMPAYSYAVYIGLFCEITSDGHIVRVEANADTIRRENTIDLLRPIPIDQITIDIETAVSSPECGICYEDFIDVNTTKVNLKNDEETELSGNSDVVEFPCPGKHRFHRSCIKTWISTTHGYGPTKTCPVCRATLPSASEVKRLQNI